MVPYPKMSSKARVELQTGVSGTENGKEPVLDGPFLRSSSQNYLKCRELRNIKVSRNFCSGIEKNVLTPKKICNSKKNFSSHMKSKFLNYYVRISMMF